MRILIVDDKKLARFSIKERLDKSYLVFEADNFEDAKRILETEALDLSFIDLNLDPSKDLQGLELIPLAVKRGVYSIVMSAHEKDEVVRKAYNLGCKDFYGKGNETSNVSETINRYLLGKDDFNGMNLISEVFPTKNKLQKEIIKSLASIIPTMIPIYITGETGTGKTFLADGLHRLSKRTGKFVSVNCGAVSKDLLEAELFGYGKGAYSGAVDSAQGKLKLADGGTLFLDEIGSMSEAMQIKLLKGIEEKKFYPVNSDKEVRTDFRLICGGLDNLAELVRQGKFRSDLFQRICGFPVKLLPLRERPEDIMPTIRNSISSMRRIVFSKDVEETLKRYDWPGNLREAIRFAEVLSKTSSGLITKEEIEGLITMSQDKLSVVSANHYEIMKKIGLEEFLILMKKEAIRLSLAKNEGVATRVIEELKISTATYYGRSYKNKELNKSKRTTVVTNSDSQTDDVFQ